MKVVLVALTLIALPGRLLSQGDTVSPERSPAESAATRRSAERAVRSFEQRRLRLLPDVPSSGSGPGDVIMVKASLGTRLGALVESLKRRFPADARC